MTPAGSILAREILCNGPISFRRFMEVALYHPQHGYYRRGADPFGRAGDFYTAAQLQPVFGILTAAYVRSLAEELGSPADFTVVDLGAGRGEMAEAFAEFRYVAVDIGRGLVPDRMTGVVFANEFFDALPVHLVVKRAGEFREMRVGWEDGHFRWIEGESADDTLREYLDRYGRAVGEGGLIEANLEALEWIRGIGRKLERGYLLAVDYGYTLAEQSRFPRGTLMSYRRHAASEDVLRDPGERDITSHVCFTALEERAAECGLERLRFESLGSMLLRAGESDQFASALAGASDKVVVERRLQLKSLLFGMGEVFRAFLACKRV